MGLGKHDGKMRFEKRLEKAMTDRADYWEWLLGLSDEEFARIKAKTERNSARKNAGVEVLSAKYTIEHMSFLRSGGTEEQYRAMIRRKARR